MGGILGRKKTPLVLWDKKDCGTITAQTYVDHVLHPVLWPFWYWESHAQGTAAWVMEDGASAHRAHFTQAHRDYYRMPSLIWPASSSDLNLIGDIWNLLKNRLNQRNPRPKGVEEMGVGVG